MIWYVASWTFTASAIWAGVARWCYILGQRDAFRAAYAPLVASADPTGHARREPRDPTKPSK